jgi:carbonic anhydrase
MEIVSLLENNRAWVARMHREDPTLFDRLSQVHAPKVLWIGCSDARVPANVVTGTDAGEMFVHRNIANQVLPMDSNLQAVVEYAIDALQIQVVVVCGHSQCGGVKAAMSGRSGYPHVDSWLDGIRKVQRLHRDELEAIADPAHRYDRLVELNVTEQVRNLAAMGTVQNAWDAGRPLRLHGWVYRLEDGLLRELGATVDHRTPAAQLVGAA